jgi:DNA-binding GntR family transcriptional regulator
MPLVSIDLPRRRSRALEIYDVLRAAILDGTLQPGERLVEGTIATLASVSRTPVREAIRMLDADKLVRPISASSERRWKAWPRVWPLPPGRTST